MKQMTLEEFTRTTASSEPVPGGGSISALAGALAAALAQMVAGLTIGKKKYEDAREEMEAAIPVLEGLWTELLEDVARDSASFDGYMKALSLPKDTEEEKNVRMQAMQEGLKEAVKVPLSVAEKSIKILPYAKLVVTRGNATALSDGLVCAMMARSAVLGAVCNVKINLKSIHDETFVGQTYARATLLEQKADLMEAEIRSTAFERLNQ